MPLLWFSVRLFKAHIRLKRVRGGRVGLGYRV